MKSSWLPGGRRHAQLKRTMAEFEEPITLRTLIDHWPGKYKPTMHELVNVVGKFVPEMQIVWRNSKGVTAWAWVELGNLQEAE